MCWKRQCNLIPATHSKVAYADTTESSVHGVTAAFLTGAACYLQCQVIHLGSPRCVEFAFQEHLSQALWSLWDPNLHGPTSASLPSSTFQLSSSSPTVSGPLVCHPVHVLLASLDHPHHKPHWVWGEDQGDAGMGVWLALLEAAQPGAQHCSGR